MAYLIKTIPLKRYGEVYVDIDSFLTSVLHGDERLASHVNPFVIEGTTPYYP
jgi:hypothetical protein